VYAIKAISIPPNTAKKIISFEVLDFMRIWYVSSLVYTLYYAH
jgi:hypothetical protein